MNVGICIRHAAQDMHEKFMDAAARGFQHCQLISWEPQLWTDEEAERIRACCAGSGVEITAFWCGWVGPRIWNFVDGPETLGLVPPAYRFARMQNLMDGADFARKLGVTDIVSHMGFIPESPSDPNYAGFVSAIRAVAARLAQTDSRYFTCHCTGQHAFDVLRETLGERIAFLAAGSVTEL